VGRSITARRSRRVLDRWYLALLPVLLACQSMHGKHSWKIVSIKARPRAGNVVLQIQWDHRPRNAEDICTLYASKSSSGPFESVAGLPDIESDELPSLPLLDTEFSSLSLSEMNTVPEVRPAASALLVLPRRRGACAGSYRRPSGSENSARHSEVRDGALTKLPSWLFVGPRRPARWTKPSVAVSTGAPADSQAAPLPTPQADMRTQHRPQRDRRLSRGRFVAYANGSDPQKNCNESSSIARTNAYASKAAATNSQANSRGSAQIQRTRPMSTRRMLASVGTREQLQHKEAAESSHLGRPEASVL